MRLGLLGAIVLLFSSSNAAAQVGFARRDFPTGGGPVAVVVADLNADGRLDLATPNAFDNTVSILLGNGDGTFGVNTDFPTGIEPRGVVAADFNADLNLDLATANVADNSLSVLLGNGDGTFQANMDFVSGIGSFALAARDFNADGRVDLAAANRAANTVSLLLGNGDGTFGPAMEFPTGAEPLSIVAGDFNGDGKLDVATSNGADNSTSVLLGNGDGTFGAKTDFPAGPRPRSLSAIDFSLDGKLDIATSNQFDSTASVLLGKGDGTFDPKTDLGTDTEPIAVTDADFDGDGKPDLATANTGCYYFYPGYGCLYSYYFYPTLSLRLGNGDGTFGVLRSFSLGSSLSSVPEFAAAGDFNADGKVDLALAIPANNTVTVLLQAPGVSLDTSTVSFGAGAVGTTSPAQGITVTNTGGANLVFSSISTTGANPGDFAIATGTTCSTSSPVAPAQSCLINATFGPTGAGARAGDISIASNAAGSPHTISLTGTGTDFALGVATGGSTSATVTAGQTATYNLQVLPTSGFNGTVTLGCSGAPSLATCTASPASVTLNGTAPSPFTVSVTTTAPSMVEPPTGSPRVRPFPAVPLVLLLLLIVVFVRLAKLVPAARWPKHAIVAALALLLFVAWIGGCADDGQRNPGTPQGTSTLTITGTSAGVSRTQSLTLTVN